MQISVPLTLSYFIITKKITVNFGEWLLLNKLGQKPQIDRIFKSFSYFIKRDLSGSRRLICLGAALF